MTDNEVKLIYRILRCVQKVNWIGQGIWLVDGTGWRMMSPHVVKLGGRRPVEPQLPWSKLVAVVCLGKSPDVSHHQFGQQTTSFQQTTLNQRSILTGIGSKCQRNGTHPRMYRHQENSSIRGI